MKKALMYLLLASGIFIAVVLMFGALMGFVAGFIDGYNGAEPGSNIPQNVMNISLAICFVFLAVVLHVVFLGSKFASYTTGRIPKDKFWKVIGLVMVAMGGLALVESMIYNPIAELGGPMFNESDAESRDLFRWAHENPWYSIPFFALIETTFGMVFFGAVLREILEWKHRPVLVIGITAVIMGVIYYFIESNPYMVVLMVFVFIMECWIYECTRSVIPVVVGDVFFSAVNLLMMGNDPSSWIILLGTIIALPAIYMLMRILDTFKPID